MMPYAKYYGLDIQNFRRALAEYRHFIVFSL